MLREEVMKERKAVPSALQSGWGDCEHDGREGCSTRPFDWLLFASIFNLQINPEKLSEPIEPGKK